MTDAAPAVRAFSGDSHLEIDPACWAERIPEPYRHRAPRAVPLSDGSNALAVEGSPLVDLGGALSAGVPPKSWMPFRRAYAGAVGAGDPDQRLAEQDRDQIAAELLFPGVNGPELWQNLRHERCYLAVVRAYNAFLAEEYSAADPRRLVGVGVIPTTGLEGALDELTYCQRAGLRVVLLTTPPSGTQGGEPDEPFFRAAQEAGVTVAIHGGFSVPSGTGGTDRAGNPDRSEQATRARQPHSVFAERLAATGPLAARAAMELAMGGLFDRLPNLRIYFAESEAGRLPYFLEQADKAFVRHRDWVARDLGWTGVERLPSDYARTNCTWGFLDDRVAVEAREAIGPGTLVWGTNFPREESRWPESAAQRSTLLAGLDPAEAARLTGGNLEALLEGPRTG